MQNSILNTMIKSVATMMSNVYAIFTGIFTSMVGYLVPVKDIVHLLIFFFALDVLFGYLAARKLRQERFSVKIIWEHTMPRMLISIVLIIGAYMWDNVYQQDIVCTHKVVGWFISGVILYSIAENGYQISNWKVFQKVAELLRGKVKDSTGLDVKDESEVNNG